MPATRTRKPKDPFVSVPGETSPARYLRLYAKGRVEGVEIERNSYGIPFALSSDMVTWYDFTCADNGEYIACSCPHGGNEPGRVCKHLAMMYPPQAYKQPCPMCSGQLVHRQEGTEHAVRCLSCHYVESWADSPPVPASVDTEAIYREMYQIERPK